MDETRLSWNFPGNGFTRENGLDTPDMETFKKDPMSSLAREICQNSLDARLNKDKPAKLVFSTFRLKSDNIPGKHDLVFQINQSLKYWSTNRIKNESIISRLEKMQIMLKQKEVFCLRISDFNTTGLLGVKDNDSTSPFYMLTRGSGVSYKSGTSGGSKGIGKYATFVVSTLHTLFYSTITIDDESGYLGISKLCSGIKAVYDDKSGKYEDTRELTIGEGYYGVGIENKPSPGLFNLDQNFIRQGDQTGTDIFVIGFENSDYWQNTVIVKILESFMVAVQRSSLEVEVDGILVNKSTLRNVVFSDIYQTTNRKTEKLIKSQYILLNDENVHTELIHIDNYGVVELKIKDFNKSKDNYSTNSCTFIRYPYMKIKELSQVSYLPCSSLAIIEDNKLNQVFRKFENPQHTNWEFSRTDYTKEERKEAKDLYAHLQDQILEIIKIVLSSSDNTESEFEGAEEFLPDESTEIHEKSNTQIECEDKPVINKRKKHQNIDTIGYDTNDKGESLQPYLGAIDDNGEDLASVPVGHNNGEDGENRPGASEQKIENGNDEVLKIVPLTGVKPRIIALNAYEGKYLIKFSYIEDEEKCIIVLNLLDDVGTPYPINITKAIINGEAIKTRMNIIGQFPIKAKQKNTIEVFVDQNEMFSSEVKIYAYK